MLGNLRKHYLKRKCKLPTCREEFIAKNPNQKYHTHNCAQLAWARKNIANKSKKPIVKEKRKCAFDGCKKYFTWKSSSPTKKYHSKKCIQRDVYEKKYLSHFREKATVISKDIAGNEKLIPFNGHYLTLSHYKEPLKAVERGKGYGYYGAMCSTQDGELVLCHICGKLYTELGKHSHQSHGVSVAEYREMFDLAKTTPLSSESYRNKQRITFMKTMKNLPDKEKKEFLERLSKRLREARKNVKNNGYKISLETKNKRGTCPDQLLDKIKEVAGELGYTPSKKDFISHLGTQRYYHLIKKTYGTWAKAIEMAGLKPKQKINGVFNKDGHNQYKKYTEDELIEYLRLFAQENNKIPTSMDFSNGLLPIYDSYIRRFGSIESARRIAGIYEIVDDEEQLELFRIKSHPKYRASPYNI